ncbi:MAG: hypothetical protein AAGA20_09835 [Planctomycetota bacterium]
MDETTKEVLKWVFAIGSLPWVLPFIRSLWTDVKAALEEDGGLLGEPPTQAKLEEIRARKAREPDPLVNEPLAHVREALEREGRTRGRA